MLQVFIINSFSGDETKTVGIREKLEEMKNMEYLVFNSEYSGHEGVLAKQMCELFPNEQIRFYSCGGSGTFRNILKEIPEKDLVRVELAEIPCGLTNDFLNIYGAEREKFRDIDSLIDGKAEAMDYLKTSSGSAHNTVSVGFDGIILTGVFHLTKLPFFHGALPYFLSSIVAVLNNRVQELEITADGEVFRGKFYEIALGNGNLLGGNFHFGDESHPKNGKMRMVLAPDKGWMYKIRMLIATLRNNQELLEKETICRMVEKVCIKSVDRKKMSINIDGELEVAQEIRVEVCKDGMNFVEPAGLKRSEIRWKNEADLYKR